MMRQSKNIGIFSIIVIKIQKIFLMFIWKVRSLCGNIWAARWENVPSDMYSVKTQISRHIRAVWSDLCCQHEEILHHVPSEDSDQTASVCRLIWIFDGCTCSKVCLLTWLMRLNVGKGSILHKWIMKAQTILVWLGSSLPVCRISVSCRIYLYKNRLDRLCRFTGWSGLPLFTNSIRALFSWHTAFWVRSHWVGYIGKDEQFSLLPYYKLIIVKEKWGIRAFINSKGPGKFTKPCNMLPDKYLCSFI